MIFDERCGPELYTVDRGTTYEATLAWRIAGTSISFFGAVGGGYARYSESKLRADRSPNLDQRDTNAGALQVGGGIDIRGFGWLGFRGELRDVYTGPRNSSISTPGPRVHNVSVPVAWWFAFEEGPRAATSSTRWPGLSCRASR